MKLLALSDIHDNLAALRGLRAAEKNVFDVVAVAGDIGNKSAAEFFDILSTFECPVVHVYGNWDDALPYDHGFRSTLLHMNVVDLGGIAFTGFSGCPADWGKNPIALQLRTELERTHRGALDAYAEAAEKVRAAQHDRKEHDRSVAMRTKVTRSPEYQLYREELRHLKDEILKRNRAGLLAQVRRAGVDPRRLVLMTHERQYRLQDDWPGLPLHLFGHQHGYSDRVVGETRCINVSILDRVVPMRAPAPAQNIQAGNYAIIEFHASGEIAARCVPLSPNERAQAAAVHP